MILRRIAATAPAVQRHVWDWVFHRLECMLEGTAEVPVRPALNLFSKVAVDGQQ